MCRLLPVPSATSSAPLLAPGAILLIDTEGAREVAAPETLIPWGWTPTGRLALLGVADWRTGRVSASAPLTTWTVDAAGGDLRREAEGAFYPVGWSPDGALLYAVGGLRETGIPGYVAPAPTSLLAIDTRTGAQRGIATADELAGKLAPGPPTAGPVHTFGGSAFDPQGGTFAFWLQRGAGVGTPTASGGAPEASVVLVDTAGRLLAQARMAAGSPVFNLAWSPAGPALGYILTDGGTGDTELQLLAPGRAGALVYRAATARSSRDAALSWSPDGRWVAFVGRDGLAIASATPPARSFPLGIVSDHPAWRPRPGP